jgi:hypothetical protein
MQSRSKVLPNGTLRASDHYQIRCCCCCYCCCCCCPNQLLEGEEGLAATRRGVEVLSAQADAAAAAAASGSGRRKGGGVAGGEAGELKQQLCSALCSLAEMTMAAAGNLEEVGGFCRHPCTASAMLAEHRFSASIVHSGCAKSPPRD